MARPRIITARSVGLRFIMSRIELMGREETVAGHYSGENTERAETWQECVRTARSFHHYHQNSKEMAGLAYHYLIADDGAIICGRPVTYKGSHVLRDNQGRVGICMPGTGPDRPTTRQARTLRWLLEHAHTAQMPKPHQTSRDISALPIFGHGEIPGQSTLCPGRFRWVYRHRGLPWVEEEAVMEDDEIFEAPEESTEGATLDPSLPSDILGADEPEANAQPDPDEEPQLPEADEEFDEDLTGIVEREAAR